MTVHNGADGRGYVPAAQPPQTMAEALAALQCQLPEVKKTQTATVRSDKGNYSYQYAGLPAVSREILPLLGSLGLSFVCRPTLNAEGKFVLAYRLGHTSGEGIEGAYPLPVAGSPQQIGSAVTYGRRYTLAAVTGLVAEDDDDGAAAGATERPARPARTRRASTPEASTVDESPKSNGQTPARRRMFAVLRKATNDGGREAGLRLISQWLGREVTSTNDITEDDVLTVIECAEAGVTEAKEDTPT